VKPDDRIIVCYEGKVVGTGEVVRVHKDGSVSLVWDDAIVRLDGAHKKLFNLIKNKTRYLSRIDSTFCEVLLRPESPPKGD
jgi:hypothetical protein